MLAGSKFWSCFNSNLVRLKVKVSLKTLGILICFNSNLVRLKEIIMSLSKTELCSFNSNLVRLKEASGHVRKKGKKLFQFQSGAIKSSKGKGM